MGNAPDSEIVTFRLVFTLHSGCGGSLSVEKEREREISYKNPLLRVSGSITDAVESFFHTCLTEFGSVVLLQMLKFSTAYVILVSYTPRAYFPVL